MKSIAQFYTEARLKLLSFLRLKSRRYWVTAASVLLGSMIAAPYLENYVHLGEVRYWLFQALGQSPTNRSEQRFFKLVMIRDDDYWDGPLDHRLPTKRDYLKDVVDALDRPEVDADLIALDFDMRLPDPRESVQVGDFSVLAHDYKSETDKLIKSIISAAAHGRKIILAKTIDSDGGRYVLRADVYQAYGICTALNQDGTWENPGAPPDFAIGKEAEQNIECGYISLPYDMRQIPPPLDVGSRGHLDSFSMAIVRAGAPERANEISSDPRYATYILQKDLDAPNVTISAHDLLAGSIFAQRELRRKQIIVGAEWRESARGTGPLHDAHASPVGPISGAFIHENFAEAVRSGRLYSQISLWMIRALEIIFGILAVVTFAVYENVPAKLVVFFGLCFLLLVLQWLSLRLFGVFFDAIVPVAALAFHSIGSRLLE